MMKNICYLKYAQESIEQESHLLEQQIAYYNLPSQSFEKSPIAHSKLMETIQHVNVREDLLNQYKQIALQSRAQLFQVCFKSIQEEKEEYTKKYDDLVKQMWSDYHSNDPNQKLSQTMIQLIEQRCQMISQRLKCIYQFKAQSVSP